MRVPAWATTAPASGLADSVPMIPPARHPRRAVLAAASALPLLGVAACTAAPRDPEGEPTPVDPLADVLIRHVALRDQYDVAIATFAESAPRLQPLRDNVREHIAALAAAQGVAPPSSGSSATGTGPASGSSAAPGTTAAPPPPDEPTARAALAAEENSLASAMTPLVSSEPADRAPLLGSIVAAHTCHAAALA